MRRFSQRLVFAAVKSANASPLRAVTAAASTATTHIPASASSTPAGAAAASSAAVLLRSGGWRRCNRCSAVAALV